MVESSEKQAAEVDSDVPAPVEKPEENRAEMRKSRGNLPAIVVTVAMIVIVYAAFLKSMFHITLSPFFVLGFLVFAAAPLAGTMAALKVKRTRATVVHA